MTDTYPALLEHAKVKALPRYPPHNPDSGGSGSGYNNISEDIQEMPQ